MTGSSDKKFLAQRRFFLERFLRKLSKYDFIINSEEFKMFSRPQSDIQKTLLRQPRLSTLALGERLSAAFDIQTHLFDNYQKDQLSNTIVEFNMFAKKVVP